MNKQLFVFDVAGTLVDLGSQAPVIAFQKAFSDHGLYPTEAQIKKPMGKNKLEHIEDILNELDNNTQMANSIYESFNNHIVSAIKETNDPIEGVVEALEKLHAAGHAVAFTTGYNATQANLALEKLDSQLSFTVPLVTASDSPGRPTPHMIYRSMFLTKTNNINDVWKIGDTLADFEAGLSAGVSRTRNISVLTGVFQGTKPSHTINLFKDITYFINWVLDEVNWVL